MDDGQVIAEARRLLLGIEGAFQGKVANFEEQRFLEGLEDTLVVIKKRDKLDNHSLIALDKFHKRTCILIGLSHFSFDERTKPAWRAYDRFYFDQVSKRLKLYGAGFLS